MASKKKPVVVTVTKSRHKTQPYTVTIDKPGSSEPYALKERYTRAGSARRAARRNPNAYRDVLPTFPQATYGKWHTAINRVRTLIEFRYIDRTKSTKRDPIAKAFSDSASWRPTAGSTNKGK